MAGADLHTHSSASDGDLPPAEVVAAAREAALEAVALTDHDTVAGVGEALAAADGVMVVPGVEISCEITAGQCHLLGYFIDQESPWLREPLDYLRRQRRSRSRQILDRLAELGMPLKLAERADVQSIGRPHIAAALKEAGYVSSHDDAFRRFLAAGRPAYIASPKLKPAEALDMILKSGGVPVLAHPHTFADPAQLGAYVRQGLLGIEAAYSGYSPAEVRRWTALAEELGLVATAGSDFHGPSRPDRPMGGVRADFRVIAELRGKRRAR